MGFWSKAKGFFGRIGTGVKKGWNWLTTNKDKIKQAAEAASDVIGGKYGDAIKQGVITGEQLYGKVSPYANQILR